MPMPAFIHAPIHMMSWVDIEEVIVPGAPPVPGPPTPYNALQFMTGIFPGVPIMGSSPLTDAKVMTIIGPPLAHGTDIGMMVPHFSPSPNLLLPLILLGSSSKNLLGASTVKIGNKPVATAIPVNVLGMNLNCSFPISLPSLVASPHTVMAGITVGDIVRASLNTLASMGIDFAFHKFQTLKNSQASEHLGNFMKKSSVYRNIRTNMYRQLREGYERTSKEAFEVAESVVSSISSKIAGLATGYTEKAVTTLSGLPAASSKGLASKGAEFYNQTIGDIFDGKNVEFF